MDLSAAHALVRFFGAIDAVDEADQALVTGLGSGEALSSGDLADYATALPGVVCARAASTTTTLGAASVELRGSVAWVVPGTGAVSLPSGTGAVVVDLRGLPDAPELRAALQAAVAPALVSPVTRPSLRVREHDGLVDEVFSAANVYIQRLATIDEPPIAGTGTTELAIGLLTDPVMPPEAARFAIAMRAAGRAFLIGEDVRADVAESRWQGVGNRGVYVRTSELRFGPMTVPDVVLADRRSTAPECVAEQVIAAGLPPAWSPGEALRAGIEKLSTFGAVQPAGESLAEAEAALLVAHGSVRRFYPYFPIVGDTIDERLEETLGDLVEPLDRFQFRNALRRFGHALVDGHNFVFDNEPPPVAGYIPVMIQDVGGEPVVRRSLAVGIDAGDTITSIDGTPVADFYAAELARSGGATPGYQFDIATRELTRLYGNVTLGLRDADGVARSIDFTPQPVDDLLANGFAPSLRPAGFLTDLGAPTIYYINLDADVLTTSADFAAAMSAAQSATGLIIDMRGYPGIDANAVARRLIDSAFSSPLFRVPILTGPDQLDISEESYAFQPNNPYTGPIALIVGHQTVSAAENFSTMLVDANRVTVVGRTSAATNGNITGVNLPGGFAFTFTGMDVRHTDGSVFHGIGIVPETESVLGAVDFRDGVDRELLDAIAVLP